MRKHVRYIRKKKIAVFANKSLFARKNRYLRTKTAMFEKNKKLTLLTEFETIELAIQIIDLVDVLHQKKIVHTNLNPKNIFLKD